MKKQTKCTLSSHKTKLILTLCAISVSSILSACSRQQNSVDVSKGAIYFDTMINVTLYEYPGNSANILKGFMDECQKYENLFSPTVEGSDIWNINHSNGSVVKVDNCTADLLTTAIKYCDISNGQIDITLGTLSSLWNFKNESNSDNPKPPSDEDIAIALSHVDYTKVHVDTDSSTVWLDDPEAQVELGFIAKGYIADKLYDYLIDCGVTSAIINLGGNVKCIGIKPDKSNFNIGIQAPFNDMGDPITTISINDSSIVSSGNYERFYYYNGKLYHHILNSNTGFPVDNDLNGVTIITKSATDADALSTMIFIMGLDTGMKYIESIDNTEAIFVDKNNSVYRTSGLSN